jgi:Flp pilus assembly protein TadG
MKPSAVFLDQRGTAAIEFGITAPAFFILIFAILELGIAIWTQVGLQHGAEMAARCASINTTICGSTSATQTYASQQAYGLGLSPSIFSVSTQNCGTMVTATYSFHFLTKYIGGPDIALNAQSCFPK